LLLTSTLERRELRRLDVGAQRAGIFVRRLAGQRRDVVLAADRALGDQMRGLGADDLAAGEERLPDTLDDLLPARPILRRGRARGR
jgi:hypothetical protein